VNEYDWKRLLPDPLADLPNLPNSNPFVPRPRLGLLDFPRADRANPFDFPSAPPPVPRLPTTPVGSFFPAPVAVPEVKRKVYFAFSFSDILRVNNVRQIGKIGASREIRNARTFYDRSIWERRSIKNDEGLKNLMRRGVKYSSAVCVLIGTDTWESRWVKYEIARAVIDGRGLFSLHINSLNHHARRVPDPWGYNPLHLMGVYRDLNGKFYLWEKCVFIKNIETHELGWEWRAYDDYTDPITLPQYIANLDVQHVMPLSQVTRQHDFIVDGGAKNLGGWIDAAAADVGR
jgi:hypothetical protein